MKWGKVTEDSGQKKRRKNISKTYTMYEIQLTNQFSITDQVIMTKNKQKILWQKRLKRQPKI